MIFHQKWRQKKSKWCQNESSEVLYYPAQKFEEFKEKNRSLLTEKSNEILARLRFNPYRSLVAICAETLDSKLLAYNFSEALLEEFRSYAINNGLDLNPNFRIPIIIYVPTKYQVNQEFHFYTEEMRQQDLSDANKIHTDPDLKSKTFFGLETVHGVESSCNYDYLLGLKDLSESHFYVPYSSSLVVHMFEDGYIKRALRLLGPLKVGDYNNLCYRIIKNLFQDRRLDVEETIFRLIVAEEFDIADFILHKYKLNKFELKEYHTTLFQFLLKNGNPRHFKYMGLEEMLIKAVDAEAWVPIKLCIKEFPQESGPSLGYLLFKACQQRRSVEVNFLLSRGADKTFKVDGQTPIACSTALQDWITLSIFTRYPTDFDDHAHYGLALLEALQQRHRGLAKLLLMAGAKTTWRATLENYELESAFFYALLDNCEELLPLLFKHENLSYPPEESTWARLRLIKDLAHTKKESGAEKLLSTNNPELFSYETSLSELDRCVLVLEALAVGDVSFVLQRIAIYLCPENRQSTQNNNNNLALSIPENQDTLNAAQLSRGLTILDRNFAIAINKFHSRLHKRIIENITLLTLTIGDITIFQTTVTMFAHLIGHAIEITDKKKFSPSVLKSTVDRNSLLVIKLINGCFEKPNSGFDVELIIFNTLLLNISEHNSLFAQKMIDTCFNNPNSQDRWEALVIKALDDPAVYNTSCLLNLHLMRYCKEENLLRLLNFIFKEGYNKKLDEVITIIVSEITKKEKFQIKYKTAFSNLWFYHPYYSNKLIRVLLSQLGANYVFHLTLLILKDILDYSFLDLKQHLITSIGKMRYCDMMLEFRGTGRDSDDDNLLWLCEQMDGRPKTVKEKTNPYQDIMIILDRYTRDDVDPLPDETIRTFDSILKIFNQIIDNSKNPRLFSEYSLDAGFNRKVFEYLSCVRDIIQAYELSASQKTNPIPNQAKPPRYTLPTEFEFPHHGI